MLADDETIITNTTLQEPLTLQPTENMPMFLHLLESLHDALNN